MSDNQNRSASSGGIGLGGAVFIVFLVLKLTGTIDWSWWWVTAPLWAPALFVIGVALGAGGIWALVAGVREVYRWHRRRKYAKLMKVK